MLIIIAYCITITIYYYIYNYSNTNTNDRNLLCYNINRLNLSLAALFLVLLAGPCHGIGRVEGLDVL